MKKKFGSDLLGQFEYEYLAAIAAKEKKKYERKDFVCDPNYLNNLSSLPLLSRNRKSTQATM